MSRLPAQAGPFRPCRHHRFSSSVLGWALLLLLLRVVRNCDACSCTVPTPEKIQRIGLVVID